MDKNIIKETFDLLSLVEKDTTLRKSGAYHVGPCPFCGGRDRFTLKNTAEGWRWHCRGCSDGKYQDAIAYVMRRDNLTFVEALQRMGGKASSRAYSPRAKKTRARPVVELPPDDWQSSGWKFVNKANLRLISRQSGEPGRDYLQSRGLGLAAWCEHLLGFVFAQCPKSGRNRPAIVIPHFDNGWKLTAVKLRFVDDVPQGLRYIARRGSKPLLWGLHQAHDFHDTLMLLEGELNAISISQCKSSGVSVLSFASENLNAAQKALLPILAGRYKRVIIWTDKGEKAREAQKAIGKRCELMKSPHGQDANDLLQAGLLTDFLREGIVKDCRRLSRDVEE